MAKIFESKYSGKCAVTGKTFEAGTMITRHGNGWAIASEVAERTAQAVAEATQPKRKSRVGWVAERKAAAAKAFEAKGQKACTITPHHVGELSTHTYKGYTITTYETHHRYKDQRFRVAHVQKPSGEFMTYAELQHIGAMHECGDDYKLDYKRHATDSHTAAAKRLYSHIDCLIDGTEHPANKHKRFYTEYREIGAEAMYTKYPEIEQVCPRFFSTLDADIPAVIEAWTG